MKRWVMLIIAGYVSGCTGWMNIWGIFQKPIIAVFEGATPSNIALVYSFALLFMGIFSPIAGRLMDKVGPKVIMILGSTVWCIGIYATSKATEVWHLYFTFSLLVGGADGFLYTNTVSNTVKWFPDKRALASGIIVCFSAAAPIFFRPMAMAHFVEATPLSTYSFAALVFISMIVVSFFISAPPAGYTPEGWDPSRAVNSLSRIKVKDVGPKTVIRDPAFYFLVIGFMVGAGTGSMMVAHSTAIGQNQVASMHLFVASYSVTIFAIFNMAGRVVLGYISDRYGRFKTQAAVFCVYIAGAGVLSQAHSTTLFMVAVGILAFGWGGTWAGFPAMCAELWGSKNMGANYGMVFWGASLGGFVFPRLAGRSYEIYQNYNMAYIGVVIFALIGLGIVAWLSQTAKKRAAAYQSGQPS